MMLEPGYYEILFNDGTMKILQVTKNPKRGYLTTTGERDLLGMDPDDPDPKWEQVFRLRPLVAGESVPVPRPKKDENPGVWRLGEIIRASLSLLPAGQPLQRHLLEAAISRTVTACPLLFSKVTLQDQQSLVDDLLGPDPIGRNVQFEHWIDMGLITGKITAVSTYYYEVLSDKGVLFGVDRARIKFL